MGEDFPNSAPQPESNHGASTLGTSSLLRLFFGAGLIALSLLGNYLLAGRSTKLLWDACLSGGALALVLGGLHLIVGALWPRFSRLGRSILLTCVVAGYILFYAFSLGLALIGSQGDYGHCGEIIHSITETASIPSAAFFPARPAIGCMEANYGLFRTRYQVVQVYGVIDRAKQDAILSGLERLKQDDKTEAMQVLFYDRENVRMWKNDQTGASGGVRGPETILRVTTVH